MRCMRVDCWDVGFRGLGSWQVCIAPGLQKYPGEKIDKFVLKKKGKAKCNLLRPDRVMKISGAKMFDLPFP